jgi:ribulose 1,5-bisphosphate synthetase/thiazole synthase
MAQHSQDRRTFIKAAAVAAASLSLSQSPATQAAEAAKRSGTDDSRATTPATQAAPRPRLNGMKVDVLVVGGGPAGIGAAIAAARAGASTLLVEDQAFFGGVGAWCMGMPINQMRPGSKARSKVHELVIEKLLILGEQAVRMGAHQLWCNVEYLKVAVLDALDAADCKYLVHAKAVDAVVENNRVAGVVVATKQGLATVFAQAVVDCTGDADVACFAGAETLKELGQLSPSTLCLGITNLAPENLRGVNMGVVADKARGKYPLIPKSWGLSRLGNSHSYYINHAGTRDLGQFDTSDPFDFSRAECLSRRQVVQMAQAMREFGGEALRGAELVGAGPRIGVRETRRLKGPYILTEQDAIEGRKFDDAVAWRSGFLDIGFVRMAKMKIHDVPYRSILPEKLDGLLTAGRCISATHVAASAGKSMGNCMATGHAAGLAAAMCAKKRCQPREIKVSLLQDALRADDVDLSRAGDDQEGLKNQG